MTLTALAPLENGQYQCEQADCGETLILCHNYDVEQVCNRCVIAVPPGQPGATLCDCCRHNQMVPDLSVEGNRPKWARLEAAKRRLFYTLDMLNLPRGREGEAVSPALTFDFKADVSGAGGFWQPMGAERVYTGHREGTITINIREADVVEREKLRVAMGEKHRTLIGHFRHEIGHYYWAVLVRGREEMEPRFRAVFGDHDAVAYQDALNRYYDEGPPADWAEHFPTEYAAMHPWEDFAETFALYLEMVDTLDTARHMELGGPGVLDTCGPMIDAYQRLGVAVNELNRSMGLKDLVTRRFNPPVIEKLHFVHDVVQGNGA